MRHNAMRDLVCAEAALGGFSPEKEKGSLLPGRSLDDGAPSRSAAGPGSDEHRRPADVWLPRGSGDRSGRPAAIDFAISSGLRTDKITRAQDGGQAIADDYALCKEQHLGTAAKCAEAGITFVPVVFEAHGGGWGRLARQTMGFVAHQQKIAAQWCREGSALRLAQRVSCTLQRESARAILRRLSSPALFVDSSPLGDVDSAFGESIAAWGSWPQAGPVCA